MRGTRAWPALIALLVLLALPQPALAGDNVDTHRGLPQRNVVPEQ